MDEAETKSSGWYPDPTNPSIQRWWNGISWGEQTRETNGNPLPTASPTPDSPMVDPYANSALPPPGRSHLATPGPSHLASERAIQSRQANPIGYAGAVLGFIGILFNVFCVPSILAIICGVIGLNAARRLRASGHRVNGWGWCVVGVVLGGGETVIYVSTAIH